MHCFERTKQIKFYAFTIYHTHKMFVRPDYSK